MPVLQLTFFNTFQAQLGEKKITKFRSGNVKAMLVYLSLQADRPHSRELLATLFWPDMPDSMAKTNLRQAIYQLRKSLKDVDDQDRPYLHVTRQTVQFNRESSHTIDVVNFKNAVQEDELEHAAAFYTGDLLVGFTTESLEFEDWLRQQREGLHSEATRVLEELGERHLRNGRASEAEKIARQQLTLEAWSETAHRQLIEALALAGNRTAALAQYEQCCAILDEELGVPPSPETEKLVERVQNNEIQPADPDLIAGRYRLDEEIGRGAMGIVYRGRDHHTGERVAIKMLSARQAGKEEQAIKRFMREGEALRRLDHPNIVKLLATDERDNKHYLVMEYVGGGDLRQMLDRGERLSVERVLMIALDLSDALARAHRLNIVHRDLKPANILLSEQGQPYLTDFGIARLGEASDLTDDGVVLGTLVYISPEACKGESLDERADIWSFGVLLYEMLTGERPFHGNNLSAVIHAILERPIPNILDIRPSVPQSVANLIQRLLVKQRENRVSSIRQVGAILEAILMGKEPTTEEIQLPQTGRLQGTESLENDVNSYATDDTILFADMEQAKPKPFQAPVVPPHFVGRRVILDAQKAQLVENKSQIVALVGMGGVGKSTLAAQVAHELFESFSDGILWGNPFTSETMTILELWGRAYDHDFSGLTDLDSRATAVRTMLADKETLIVLDNVEDVATVRPLLQNGENCAVLLTTRNLDIASALNAEVVRISELEEESSVALLREILGNERVSAEAEAAVQICQQLHHLPLAVEIAAQRLKSRARMKLEAMAGRLDSTKHRLGLSIGDQAVRASFQVSWEALSDEQQETFAGMAMFAGRPFTVEALAAVLGKDEFDTEDDLYALAALSLAAESGEISYQQHLLLVDFAAEKLGDTAIYTQRYIDYYLQFSQDNREQFEELDPEWPNLMVAIDQAHAAEQWQIVLDFCDALASSWLRYGRFTEGKQAYNLAETAAKHIQDDNAIAQSLLRWAEIQVEQSNYDEAYARLARSLETYYEQEDDTGIARSLYFQGLINHEQGDYALAQKLLTQSYQIHVESGDKKEQARLMQLLATLYYDIDDNLDRAEQAAKESLNLISSDDTGNIYISALKNLAMIEIDKEDFDQASIYAHKALNASANRQELLEIAASRRIMAIISRKSGEYKKAEALAQSCLAIFRKLGHRRFEGMILNELARNYIATQNYASAQECTEQCLKIYQEIGDRLGYGFSLLDLGDIHQHLVDPKQAQEAWSEAEQIGSFLGHQYLTQAAQKALDNSKQ